MGWKDRLDVLRWMEVANELFAPEGSQTRMVVHGISMGAATTVCVSGEPQPPFVNCLWKTAVIPACGMNTQEN